MDYYIIDCRDLILKNNFHTFWQGKVRHTQHPGSMLFVIKKNAKPFTMSLLKVLLFFLSKSPQLLPRDDQNCNVQNKMQPILLPDKKCKSLSKIVATAKAVSERASPLKPFSFSIELSTFSDPYTVR
jgi:hypothetical protein